MAEFSKNERHDFDLEVVHQGFLRCRQNNDQLILRDYLEAYHELNRFFRLSGRLFGFVAKDLEEKIHVLESHMNSPNGQHYNTIQSMIEFEVTNKITKVKHKLPSGSRSLLRLHRGLEFILEFMKRLGQSSDDDRSSLIAAETYKDTLSKYHPWIVQKMAGVAMYMLPSRRQLFETMCKHDYTHASELLESVVNVGEPVYDRTQNIFSEHELLDLP
ncbi:ceramide-1-phosphate transfer protein-like [Saccostrea echinata]|uniref:ceramide-1-phosphate transfer protein-like n=1 Tax=Saccostrea echinata TaxID=191078 RepID=UPI002A812515|nr:ceramide-1-phosphate transfer protein-like [Saccostrea echinata]